MNKKFIFLTIFLTMVFFIIVYFSPYLTIYSLKRAAEAKDSDKLSQYVDFPTLRESFKANVSAYMASQITKSSNGFEAFGMAIGTAMVNQMADAMITPEYLAMVIKGQTSPIGETNTQQESKPPSKADVDISMSYKGFNQFFVIIKAKDNSTEPVTLIFTRYGVVSWKLVGLRLPFASSSLLGASQNQNLISQKSETPNAINNNNALLIPSLTNKIFQAADYQNGILQDAIWRYAKVS